MNKKIIIVSSLVLALVLASGVFAYNMHGDRGHMKGYYNDRGMGRNCYDRKESYDRKGCGGYGRNYYGSALKDEDISKIQALEEKYRPQINTLKTEIYNQRQAIRLEMTKEKPNQNAINSAIDAKNKAESSLEKLMSEYRIQMRDITKK